MDQKNPQKIRKSATITTIAAELGISPSTVSRALRGDKSVTSKTTSLVQDTAKRMGYRRDFRGVMLRTGKTNMLCAILASNPTAEFGDTATMHLIQGLIDGTKNSDSKMVIQPVIGEDEQFAVLQDLAQSNRFDGFIFDHTSQHDPRAAYLMAQNIPFVSFGRTNLPTEHAYFDIDNKGATLLATQNLIAMGHKRIALINPPAGYLFSQHREDGYRAALKNANMGDDACLIVETDLNATGVKFIITELFNLTSPPTAFVTSNEMATVFTVRACRELHRDFDNIDIVSTDGTRFFDYFQPNISSCYYPIRETGKQLTEMLISAIEGTPVRNLQYIAKSEFISRLR